MMNKLRSFFFYPVGVLLLGSVVLISFAFQQVPGSLSAVS